ncbi:hypothetical protein NEMIN01_1941 [Nematocida minor]|uniref:uncharacterized protein n=1 Tax=Nematocida minor TaxID=1912983 RepID=UPI00221F167B|nr:uncharacterized protein NEMIN01_1941 [Nematocida minor]KAI5192312.1 hypothetical protein NEMIN01_1941 [Nematocida minor]
MGDSIWDSSETEMDLIRKESAHREEAIQKEQERIEKEANMERGKAYTDSALGQQADTLVEFLGYIKALAVKEHPDSWILHERGVWDALKKYIHKCFTNSTDERATEKQITEKVKEIIGTRERSFDKIKEYFTV